MAFRRSRKNEKRSTYGCPGALGAHGIEQAALPPDGENLLHHEQEQEPAACGEVDVVDLEERSELHRITVTHEPSQAENGGEVSDEACDDDRGSRERGDTWVVRDEMGREMPFFGNDREECVGERGHWDGEESECGGRATAGRGRGGNGDVLESPFISAEPAWSGPRSHM
jgi:hypothetical protein